LADVKKVQIEIEMDATGAIKGIKGLGTESDKLTKKTGKNSKKMKSDWKSTVLGINQGLELAKKGFNALKKVFDLNKEFLKYKQGMDALARNTGQNADMIVSKLREVSDGTVANKDLMLAANRAVALNVTKDVDKMAQLMEISRLKAKAMGTTTTDAFNDMVTGIGRGSPLILDNLGIITKGWAEEAKAAGVAMDAQFILNKVLADGAEELKNAGETGLTGAERIEKLGATFENLRLAVGEFIKSDAAKGFIEFTTKLLETTTDVIQNWARYGTQLSDFTVQLFKTNEHYNFTTESIKKQLEQMERYAKKTIELGKAGEDVTERQEKFRKGLEELGIEEIKNEEIFLRVQRSIRTQMDKTQEKHEETLKKSTAFTEEELEARKSAWNQYYTFIGDQRTLDIEQENEDYQKSIDSLKLLLEQRQITKSEYNAKELELKAYHNENLAILEDEYNLLRIERNRLANEQIGMQYEELTIKQQMEIDKQIEAQGIVTKNMQDAWNTAIGNAVNSFSQGMVDMVFSMDAFKGGFTGLVKNIISGFVKMIAKALIMKAVMSSLGGIGLFFGGGGLIPKLDVGGKLSGPSHSQGGIDINAEGGEFVVRKKYVNDSTLPLLMAINSGMTNLASMAMRPIQKFETGGAVTNNNTSSQTQNANIGTVNIVEPNPRKLFNQFVGFAEDMGVNLLRRG
jgi:hypothetical protein